MELGFDKTGLVYIAKLTALLAVIFVSAQIVAHEIDIIYSPSPIPELVATPAVDEGEIFVDTPRGRPVFLDAKKALKKKDSLIWEKQDFVFVDLKKNIVETYKGGAPLHSFPVVNSGAPGSFFALPSGLYAVQGKADTYLSRIGKINLSRATFLYGNYVISARPQVTKETEAHASIELAAADAEAVSTDVHEGTKVLVYNDTISGNTTFSYFRRSNLPHQVPEVTAAAVLAADVETGEILFEKNKNDAFPLASVSKLMTGVVALDRLSLTQKVTITRDAYNTYGNSGGFSVGEIFSLQDLLYGMILPSSNDAAEAFREMLPDFLEQMNAKAKALGMTAAHYHDSSGLSTENIASANDLFKLMKYIYEYRPQLLEVTKTAHYTASSQKQRHTWTNINWPAGDKSFLGGKAGWIEDSLQTMVGVYAVRVSEYNARPIAIIVLGSRNRVGDIRALVHYFEQSFIYGAKVVTPEKAALPRDRASVIDAAQ